MGSTNGFSQRSAKTKMTTMPRSIDSKPPGPFLIAKSIKIEGSGKIGFPSCILISDSAKSCTHEIGLSFPWLGPAAAAPGIHHDVRSRHGVNNTPIMSPRIIKLAQRDPNKDKD